MIRPGRVFGADTERQKFAHRFGKITFSVVDPGFVVDSGLPGVQQAGAFGHGGGLYPADGEPTA
jgi:hypothetical protein